MENLLGEWSICFCGTGEGAEGGVGVHPGLQLSDTSRATVNVSD